IGRTRSDAPDRWGLARREFEGRRGWGRASDGTRPIVDVAAQGADLGRTVRGGPLTLRGRPHGVARWPRTVAPGRVPSRHVGTSPRHVATSTGRERPGPTSDRAVPAAAPLPAHVGTWARGRFPRENGPGRAFRPGP